ncbi:WavE lipopolysaccharide synthesis family protein [Erwinia billingiae]|uniref:WavE lipopolysaccharide synthesis family protein n=1 Tax=Erwinia billingiae TaxID=182337 RepID=UPI00320B53E0
MKNLSIIFQGPAASDDGTLCPQVYAHLRRTRQAFPAAEIILSTWSMPPERMAWWRVSLEVIRVRLVMSSDPGSQAYTIKKSTYITNLNRLLISSQAGLAHATQPLAVKLRTDSGLTNRKLVALLNQQVLCEAPTVPRDPAYRIFRSRVINADWYARDARGSLPYLYHPGDILLAGYTEDLRLFFSAPPAGAELFRPSERPGLSCPWRYVPEQWFWLNAIHKTTGEWVYHGNFDHDEQHIVASEQSYLANFVPYSARSLGFSWPKYWRSYPFRGLFSIYTHRRWQRLAARTQGLSVHRFTGAVDEMLTTIWRGGYRLRNVFLRYSPIRRIAMRLFVHRR